MGSNVGSVLSTLRKNAGLSREYLAEKLDVSAETIARYERGNRKPKSDFIQRASVFFGVSADMIMGQTSSSIAQKKEDPAEGLGEVGLDFALHHNQQDYLRKGDAAGVCPGAQPLLDKEPLRPESFHAAVAIPVFKYSEIMSLGSDKVKPVGCLS